MGTWLGEREGLNPTQGGIPSHPGHWHQISARGLQGHTTSEPEHMGGWEREGRPFPLEKALLKKEPHKKERKVLCPDCMEGSGMCGELDRGWVVGGRQGLECLYLDFSWRAMGS